MTPDPSSVAASNAAPTTSPTVVRLGGRTSNFNDQFDVFFDHPLPHLARPGVQVYQARSVRGTLAHAYVCEHTALPRLQVVEKYTGLQTPGLLPLLARGVLHCIDGYERYAFFYEQRLGEPIVPTPGESLAYGWKSDLVLAAVLKPLASTLQDVHNADLVHGGIRVNNLFDNGIRPVQRVLLGEGLSTAYLAAQPPLYLPPHLTMMQPMGRGLGVPADDIYALGVTCALLLRAHDPMQGKTDEYVLMNKLDFGSFSTLIENERLPSNVLELLRGLLNDDPVARWTISDINDWFEGKRVTPRQGTKKLKASRHIGVGDKQILLPAAFSWYASQDVVPTVKMVESSEIKQWIRRSISDARLDQRYDEAVGGGPRGEGLQNMSADLIACRVCIAMEPGFPIVYRGVNLVPESFGHVLAEIMMREQDVRPIVDLINDQVVSFWMNMQNDIPSDMNMIISRFEQCQQFLKQQSIGYGIERCAYFLAPDIPCLSSVFKTFYVYTPENLLVALNAIADLPNRPERMLDRHMVAFLSVRDRKLVDPYLPDLWAKEYHRQVMAMLSTLAAIQTRARMAPVPALTRWAQTLLEPLYERFHDRDIRVSLAKKINDLKDSGYLSKMVDLLFDPERVRRDQYDYRIAAQEYYQLSNEKRQLIEALQHQDRFGTQAGRDMGALIAGVIMALSVAGFVLMRVTQGTVPW